MKAFVIIKGWGEYSGRGETPVKVYLDQAKAQAVMALLDGVAKSFDKRYAELTRQPGNWHRFPEPEVANALNVECEAEYAKIGFDAGLHDDWELAEAEFVT